MVDADGFESCFREVGPCPLPEFTGTRVMMMPLIVGDPSSIPAFLSHYQSTLITLFGMAELRTHGHVGYVTIDEKHVEPAKTHRRAGMHVDGVYRGRAGGWGGGGGGSWGSHGNGMLTVSNPAGCRAWSGRFRGWPGMEGECDHLAAQCTPDRETMFKPGVAYWVDGLCVHESVPMARPVDRTFVRLSLPSDGPWFDGYTENPLGIKPSGEILPRRAFM